MCGSSEGLGPHNGVCLLTYLVGTYPYTRLNVLDRESRAIILIDVNPTDEVPAMHNLLKKADPAIVKVATREEVESLKVGDYALDCFGTPRRIARVTYRGTDINGRAFICFATEFGPTSTITQSYKEDELVRTTAITSRLNSHECDLLESHIVSFRKQLAREDNPYSQSVPLQS